MTSAVVGFPVGVAEVKHFLLQYKYFEIKHDVDCRGHEMFHDDMIMYAIIND